MPAGIGTIALAAIVPLSFAFAAMNRLEHREQAFQASSPKNFQAGRSRSAFFLSANASRHDPAAAAPIT
jgi:hypothetical protein